MQNRLPSFISDFLYKIYFSILIERFDLHFFFINRNFLLFLDIKSVANELREACQTPHELYFLDLHNELNCIEIL